MRVQYTLKPTTVQALTDRAEAADLPVSRVVEHVLSQWLLKNEPLVFGTMPSVVSHSAPPVSMTTAPMQRLVDRVTFKMPICAECTLAVKEEDIGPGDVHIGCPGRT